MKKAWIGVRWAATQVCKGALDILADTWKGLCVTGVDIAQAALNLAIKALDIAQKVVNAVKSLIDVVLAKVTSMVEMLSTFVLNFVGFATSGFTGGQFGFIAKLTMSGTPKEYKFNYTMKKGQTLLGLATEVFLSSIKKAFDDALAWIKKKIKAVFVVGEAEDLVELEDMDAKSRAAARKNSLSVKEFINREVARSSALAQGSFKKKPTQVLVRASGRDYLMKTSFASFSEMTALWESSPMNDRNAHWHLWKRAEKGAQDLESALQASR